MPASGEDRRWAGVVLAGGRGTRMGGGPDGVDKAALTRGGTTFLERSLAALVGGAPIVVVAAPRATSRPVEFVLESPAGGGPAAGLLAAAELVGERAELLVVLAVDMPWVEASTVARLLAAVTSGADGPVLDGPVVDGPVVDGAVLDDGRPQHLAAAYRLPALLTAAPETAARNGLSMRRLVGGLTLVSVPAHEGEARDVDTPGDWDH